MSIDTTFFKTYSSLSLPNGLSKSKEGFFTGVIDAIKNPATINKVRATNIAKKWSNILNDHQNRDVLTSARDAGFDDALWAKFAEISGISYEKEVKRTEQPRQEYRKKSNEPLFSGFVKMTVSDLKEGDDGYTFYEVTTPLLDVDVEGCFLRKVGDRRYGFRISEGRFNDMFEDDVEVVGDHVFLVEWNYSRRDSSYINAFIKSVNDDAEPNIHPRVYKPRAKPKVIATIHVPLSVTQNDDGTYRLSSKMFKYPKDEDGNQLYLRKIGNGVCGFPSIPSGVIERIFSDAGLEERGGTHTFNVVWKSSEYNGRTRIFSSIGAIEDDFETNLEYFTPRKVYKKKKAQEETETTEPETVEE